MPVLNEGQHTGEFLVSEGNGSISREVGTLLSGEDVVDGQIAARDGSGKLVAAAGTFDTEGVSDEDIVGVFYGDANADGADLENVVYIARLAEVDKAKIHLPEVATADAEDSEAAVYAALADLHIIGRE